MQVSLSATQSQITDWATILEEIQERQSKLTQMERENRHNDNLWTVAVVGAYILIKAAMNAIKIKDYIVRMTGGRRMENGIGAMDRNAQFRVNNIPLM